MASHKKSIYPELGFLQWKKSIPINVMDSYFSWKQRFEVEWWICFLQTHSFSLDHCRGSTGEQVMLHFSKSVLMKKGEYIFTRFLGELFISAAWNLYQERMGPNFNTKTPETHNPDAQMSFTLFWKEEEMLHHGKNPNYFETCSRHQI